MPLSDTAIDVYAYLSNSLQCAISIGQSVQNLPIIEHVNALKSRAHSLGWTLMHEGAHGHGSGLLFRGPKHKSYDFCTQVAFHTALMANYLPRTELVQFQLVIRSHGRPLTGESHPLHPGLRLLPYVTYLPAREPEMSLCQCFGTTFMPISCHARSLWECSACIAMIRLCREIGKKRLAAVPIRFH